MVTTISVRLQIGYSSDSPHHLPIQSLVHCQKLSSQHQPCGYANLLLLGFRQPGDYVYYRCGYGNGVVILTKYSLSVHGAMMLQHFANAILHVRDHMHVATDSGVHIYDNYVYYRCGYGNGVAILTKYSLSVHGVMMLVTYLSCRDRPRYLPQQPLVLCQ